ncbi:glycosyl transferase [Synechococcus sp. GFB01]|nr:glycosyl transferase [Synechococcus sp. GFB01]
MDRLVESLQRQSYPHWRVLFIDGPSRPEHRARLEELAGADPRLCWQPQDPALPGIFGAMNQGFSAARPDEWLLFWGSDDWAPAADVLERAAATLAEGDSCDLLVCTGRYVRHGSPGRPSRFRRLGSYRCSLFLGSTPPHQATLISPQARSLGLRYSPLFRLSGDLDYFLQLSSHGDLRVRSLDLVLVHMAAGGVSGVQHRRRLREVRLAYLRAFGSLWVVPFALRYLQRALSLLEGRSVA